MSALRPCSTIIVVLRGRGATLGGIALVTTTDSNRRYDREDLKLARQLADRAALRIDNLRLLARANSAVRSRDEMIAVVSHDLKSPLQSIASAASMLQLDDSPDDRLKCTETIELATSQMDRMLTDLLDISCIDAGRFAIDPEYVDVASLLSEARALFEPLAAGRSVRFECRVEEGLPRVCVDRSRILQVLSNLLGNALKFVGAGGRIELGATLDERGRVRIAVTDDGDGIREEDLPRIFERFWRGEGRSTGAGLGLALVNDILEAHGGTVDVVSRPGEGSTFSFVLEERETAERVLPPERMLARRDSLPAASVDLDVPRSESGSNAS